MQPPKHLISCINQIAFFIVFAQSIKYLDILNKIKISRYLFFGQVTFTIPKAEKLKQCMAACKSAQYCNN